jgi:DNA-binding response OmpR family regulator
MAVRSHQDGAGASRPDRVRTKPRRFTDFDRFGGRRAWPSAALRDNPVRFDRGVQVLQAHSSAEPFIRPVAMGEEVRILLVDRAGPWRAELSAYLQEEGFEVLLASRAAEAEAFLFSSPADLVLLQTRSCSGGLALCRRLCAEGGAPVMLVSEHAGEVDRIIGLEVGADDFVSPACSHRELLARMRAVLRRQARREAPVRRLSGSPERAPIRFAGWALSPWKLEIQSPNGERSLLSPSDFKLLSVLLDHPMETITRPRMADLLAGPDANPRSLDTAVCRLRRKLGSTPAGEPVIRTVHGVGYMLTCPVDRGEGVGAAPAHRQAAG